MKTIHNIYIKSTTLLVCLLLPSVFCFGQLKQHTITFDDCQTKDLRGCYTQKYGIEFSNVIEIRSTNKARSAPNVASAYIDNHERPGKFEIAFIHKVKKIQVFTGLQQYVPGATYTFIIEVYNSSKALINNTKKEVNTPVTKCDVMLEIAAPPNEYIEYAIIKVVIGNLNSFLYVDDLTFWYEENISAGNLAPPKVVITDASVVTNNEVEVKGKITGEKIRFSFNPPIGKITQKTPYSYLPLSISEIPLFEDGFNIKKISNKEYLFKFKYPLSYLGNIKIEVIAENVAGTGYDSKQIIHFPSDIQNEKNNSGYNYGSFQFGEIGDCITAIYEYGAICKNKSGEIISIKGKIFDKWFKWRNKLGCPQSKEIHPSGHRWGDPTMTTVTINDAVLQDFSTGRIYSGPKGAFYMIDPFLDAVKQLDFDVNFGIPVSDPIEPLAPYGHGLHLPKLWQRFEITNDQDYYNLDYSAMEITDNPLTLWIATPDLLGWLRANTKKEVGWKAEIYNNSGFDNAVHNIPKRLSTVWREYRCNDMKGPCNSVGKIPSFGVPAYTQLTPYAKLSKACNDDDYTLEAVKDYVGGCPDPAQWMNMSKNKMKYATGVVKRIGLSSEDNPANHYCRDDLNGMDINLYFVPDPGYEYLLGDKQVNSDFGMEIEYEWCLFGYPHPIDNNDQWGKGPNKNQIQKGDKLLVAGRWIADCGHDFRSEIHPPAVMLNMYTDYENNKKMTKGDMLHFDWWYPGEKVKVSLFPPPRPTAHSKLNVSLPLSVQLGGKSNTKYTIPIDGQNHVKLEIIGREDIPTNNIESIQLPLETCDGQIYFGKLLEDVLSMSHNLIGLPKKLPEKRKPMMFYYDLSWTIN